MYDHYITFGAPDIRQPEIDEVIDTLKSGWLGPGPKVARFEEMFREYTGARYAVATNSCTAALHLSLIAADIGTGYEVITTPMTFAATVNAIFHAGAKPILVDCDRETGLIDPQRVEDAVRENTRAILPVHLYGRPCNMDALMDIARKHDLLIVEDAAHAIEAEYHGMKVGNIGEFTCFSFYPTKNVITGGGGMVTTNRQDWAELMKLYSNHGMDKDAWKRYSSNGYRHYEIQYSGFEYCMTDLHAALGLHQLSRAGENWWRRDAIWKRYNEAFADLPVGLPPADEPHTVHARHLYTLMIDPGGKVTRNEFMQALHMRGVGTGVSYLGAHLHPFYRRYFNHRPEDFPNATYISERTVSLPLSPGLTDDEVGYIIETVKAVL